MRPQCRESVRSPSKGAARASNNGVQRGTWCTLQKRHVAHKINVAYSKQASGEPWVRFAHCAATLYTIALRAGQRARLTLAAANSFEANSPDSRRTYDRHVSGSRQHAKRGAATARARLLVDEPHFVLHNSAQ